MKRPKEITAEGATKFENLFDAVEPEDKGRHAKMGALIQELRESLRPKGHDYYRDWYDHLIGACESNDAEVRARLQGNWQNVYEKAGDPITTPYEIWIDRMHPYFSEQSVTLLKPGDQAGKGHFAFEVKLTKNAQDVLNEATCLLKLMLELHDLQGEVPRIIHDRPKVTQRRDAVIVYRGLQDWERKGRAEDKRTTILDFYERCATDNERSVYSQLKDWDTKAFNDYVSGCARTVKRRIRNVAEGKPPGP